MILVEVTSYSIHLNMCILVIQFFHTTCEAGLKLTEELLTLYCLVLLPQA